MNLELRTDILLKSLNIEDVLSRLLAILFRVSKDSSKTLGPNSSALSFKAKADLLFDLGRLQEVEYKDLIMFMEIRNQLIHNLDTDTLFKAAVRCQKLAKLLSLNSDLKRDFDMYEDLNLKEGILKLAFLELYGRIINFLGRILHSVSQEIQDEETRKTDAVQLQILFEIADYLDDAINKVSSAFDNIMSDGELSTLPKEDIIKHGIWRIFWINVKDKHPDIYDSLLTKLKNEGAGC